MRTQAVVVGVLCVLLAGAVFSLAPTGGSLLDGSSAGIDSGQLQDQANDSGIESGFNGSAETEDEGSLIGTIISGGQAVFSLVGTVVLVPNLLQALGLPYWFAQPVGWGATVIASIGAIQFVTGRRYT